MFYIFLKIVHGTTYSKKSTLMPFFYKRMVVRFIQSRLRDAVVTEWIGPQFKHNANTTKHALSRGQTFLLFVVMLCFCYSNSAKENGFLVQLNEYETDPCFLQIFQSNTTVCLIIHVFCKSCEPEIVLHPFCFDLHYCRIISCSQILQNVHWKF